MNNNTEDRQAKDGTEEKKDPRGVYVNGTWIGNLEPNGYPLPVM